MNSKINILIPDGHSTWTMSVVNCLSAFKNYKLFILSDKKNTSVKFSRYTQDYKFVKYDSDAERLQIILKELKSNNIHLILPIAEEAIQFIIENLELLSSEVKIIPLPKLTAFKSAINKFELSKFLNDYNLPHPKSIFIDSKKSFEEFERNFTFPILVKPLHEKGGDGIRKFNSLGVFKQFYSNQVLFIQEYIDGYDIDCSVLCDNGKILNYTIQKGNLAGHNQFAPQLGLEFLENKEVLEVVRHLMELLNWSGVAHIDLRYDAHVKNFKIIEINARFWGSVEASKVAGINFPQLVIETAMGNSNSKIAYKPITYLRFKGFLKTVKRNPLSIFNIKFILNYTEARSVLKDPLPTLYKFREWFGRIITFKSAILIYVI